MKKLIHNTQALSLLEILVVTAIMVFLFAGTQSTILSGRSITSTKLMEISLRESLRTVNQRISRELSQSGFNQAGTLQVQLINDTGINNSDIIRFSIPIICEANTSILNSDGDVAYWGAPLTWGCSSSTCMDEDNDCSLLEYKYIEYAITETNQIVRRILDINSQIISENNITDSNISITNMQITSSADQNIFSFIITAQGITGSNRVVISNDNFDVYLRNRG